MRKLLLSVVASCTLVAVAPATALARGHHHRSRVHHTRVHHRKFGTDPSSTTSGTSSSGQTAGTVQSFMGGVLTILLSDGKTTVSGQVTTLTAIECRAPEQTGMQSHDRGEGGGDQGGSNDQGDDDQGQGDNAGGACGSSALTPGAMVQEAELSVSGAGAVWRKVELVSSSSSSGSSSGGDD